MTTVIIIGTATTPAIMRGPGMVIVRDDITATDAIVTTIDAAIETGPGGITASTAIVTVGATTGDNLSR